MPDVNRNVESPEHYMHGGIECIDVIRAALTEAEWTGFVKGNVIKYIWRANEKGGIEDIMKANWYLGRFLLIKGACNDTIPRKSGGAGHDVSTRSAVDTNWVSRTRG